MKSECDRALEADRNSRDELNKLRASKESKKGEDKKNEKLEDERNLKEVKIAEKQRWEEVLKVERKRWAEISQKRELEIKEEPKREKMIWEEEKRHGQKLVLDLEEKISGGQVLILKVEEGKELGRTLISNLQGDVRDKSRMLLELRDQMARPTHETPPMRMGSMRFGGITRPSSNFVRGTINASAFVPTLALPAVSVAPASAGSQAAQTATRPAYSQPGPRRSLTQ